MNSPSTVYVPTIPTMGTCTLTASGISLHGNWHAMRSAGSSYLWSAHTPGSYGDSIRIENSHTCAVNWLNVSPGHSVWMKRLQSGGMELVLSNKTNLEDALDSARISRSLYGADTANHHRAFTASVPDTRAAESEGIDDATD